MSKITELLSSVNESTVKIGMNQSGEYKLHQKIESYALNGCTFCVIKFTSSVYVEHLSGGNWKRIGERWNNLISRDDFIKITVCLGVYREDIVNNEPNLVRKYLNVAPTMLSYFITEDGSEPRPIKVRSGDVVKTDPII